MGCLKGCSGLVTVFVRKLVSVDVFHKGLTDVHLVDILHIVGQSGDHHIPA